MKYKYIAYTLLLALTSTLTQAQVKIGKNPTIITPGAVLDIEGSTTTTRTVSLPNGNFGIGTVAPAAKLDIGGDIGFYGSSAHGKITGHDNSLFVQTGTSGLSILNNAGTANLIEVQNGGNVGINSFAPVAKLDVGGDIGFYGSRANGTIIGHDNSLFIQTGTSGLSILNSDQNYNLMQIQNNGLVGIGTTVPVTKLDIAGDIGFYGSRANGTITGHDNSLFVQTGTAGLSVINNAGNANFMQIQNNGLVGIGTTVPVTKLDVGGDIGFYGSRTNGTIIGHDNSLFIQTGTSGLSILNSDQNYNLMQIQNNGLVGIGTTVPVTKLDIAGKLRVNDGSQGTGKVLTSDANGIATWVSGTTIRLINGAVPPRLNDISTSNVTPSYTGASITVPAGNWLIFFSATYNNATDVSFNLSYDLSTSLNYTLVQRVVTPPAVPNTLTGGSFIFVISVTAPTTYYVYGLVTSGTPTRGAVRYTGEGKLYAIPFGD